MEDDIYGRVYYDENDQRFHYHCPRCSTSYSGSDEYRIEIKADNHNMECYD